MAIFWKTTVIELLARSRGLSTQQDVNRAAGLSRLAMHNILRSGPLTRIDVPTLEKLAAALGVHPFDLLDVHD